jgi:hypothetical protein
MPKKETETYFNERRIGLQHGIKIIAVWVSTQTVFYLFNYIAFRK